MKKFITLLLFLILPLGGLAGKNIPKNQLSSFFSEYRYEPGVEMVRLGGLSAFFIKAMVKKELEAEDDPEAQALLNVLRGIRRFSVLDYEDASDYAKEKITRRLNSIFDGVELLMEVKSGDECLSMYGVCSESGDMVRDFVIYSPSDCALICLFGTISMRDLNTIVASND